MQSRHNKKPRYPKISRGETNRIDMARIWKFSRQTGEVKDELGSKSLFLEIVQMYQHSEAGRFAALACAALSGESLL